MALLSFEYQYEDWPSFMAIAAGMDVVSAQALGYVGNQAKRILKASLLSGQVLEYHGGGSGDKWHDKAGKRKASYRIARGATAVIISSYPANFFTVPNVRQRDTRLWKQLKAMTDSKLNQILKDFDHKYLEATMKKMTDSPLSRQRF